MIGKQVKYSGDANNKKTNDSAELPRLIGTKSQASTARYHQTEGLFINDVTEVGRGLSLLGCYIYEGVSKAVILA